MILHPDAYRDGILSFSIPYVIGAIIYYLDIYYSAYRQNKMLQDIKERTKLGGENAYKIY